MIYVMQAGERGPVKIGYVKLYTGLEPRRQALQIGCPHELTLLASCPGEAGFEGFLHERFAEYRTRGEWFIIPTEVVPEWNDVYLVMTLFDCILDRMGYRFDGGWPVEEAVSP